MITVPMSVSAHATSISMTVNIMQQNLDMRVVAEYANAPAFSGEYEYTPSNEEQEIPIAGKRATSNIIINPIPNNYGLITWNGSTITVS